MKKLYLLILVFACLHPLQFFAQGQRSKAVASPAQLKMLYSVPKPSFAEPPSPLRTYPTAQPIPRSLGNGHKVAAVNPTQLGTATNVFTIITTEQNQVIAVDSLDLIAFIHRNDITVFGGSSGQLRYDISIDGGATFSNDIGILNPLSTRNARYPNMTLFHNAGGTNPLDARMVYAAPTIDNGGTVWDGHVVGMSEVTTTGMPTGTENYVLQGIGGYIPTGLCQSAQGVFWTVDGKSSPGGGIDGDIYVNKGVYNVGTQDVDWVRWDTIPANHYTLVNGDPVVQGLNIAFAPDGQTGWVAWSGDLVGGPDSTLQPIFSKTTDCGMTWSNPVEFDLNSIPWVKDSLQTLWIDSLGNPAANGRATCSYDADLTVDVNGNPHFGVVITSGIDYRVISGLAKFLADITTTNGGTTWTIDYISPILSFRTQDFGTSPIVVMDNFVQLARDEGGCNIFFSWADSDTATVTGNGNGTGFGEPDNLAPNLRMSAKNVVSGLKTYPRLVTDLDLLWDGAILFPTLAPIVLSDPSGWRLPIVTVTMSGNDPLAPASFWYFGNDAIFDNTGWCTPASMQLSWDFYGNNAFVSPCSTTPVAYCNRPVNGPCVVIGVADALASGLRLDDAYPNPASGTARISFFLPEQAEVKLSLLNHIGQEVAVIGAGEYGAGQHDLNLNTSLLASGMYFYQLKSGLSAISRKLLVTH
jgi:hypothetical protein